MPIHRLHKHRRTSTAFYDTHAHLDAGQSIFQPTPEISHASTILDGGHAETAGQAAERMTSVQILPVGGLGSVETAQIRGAGAFGDKIFFQLTARPVGEHLLSPASQDMSRDST